jgi:radical SAM-linked protein
MSKYILKYNKTGYLKYISHLDLMRLFHRSFKRAEIKLKYSNGYNPHPKMVIAQPLSLGYESTSEYLEIDTWEEFDQGIILSKLNSILPNGIKIIACKSLENFSKTLAALVEYAEYEIKIDSNDLAKFENLVNFLNAPEILIEKYQHKSNTTKTIDIKPLIKEFSYKINENNIVLNAIIRTGSNQNLNPEHFIQGILKYCDIESENCMISIVRTEIFFEKDNIILPIQDICN